MYQTWFKLEKDRRSFICKATIASLILRFHLSPVQFNCAFPNFQNNLSNLIHCIYKALYLRLTYKFVFSSDLDLTHDFIVVSLAFECRCAPGYVTQTDTGLCLRQECGDGSHFCLNGGSCSGASSCSCPGGFNGDSCENGKLRVSALLKMFVIL